LQIAQCRNEIEARQIAVDVEIAASFPLFVFPMGDTDIGPFGYKRMKGPLKPGMVLAAEAFQSRPGVGAVGFENNFIVTDTGAEVLDKTPMLFW
jgi:Xaa-Pro dipeptidase